MDNLLLGYGQLYWYDTIKLCNTGIKAYRKRNQMKEVATLKYKKRMIRRKICNI